MMPKGKRSVAPTEDTSGAMEADADAMVVDDGATAPSAPDSAEASSEPMARPSKKPKVRKPAAGSSSDAQTCENGVLRALVLENFMNHTNTRVEFDPHVNFIVGANGSGKSAIVNALIAGFGHKAATTGRNSSKTATLIKHGASYALIQMHLANGGEDAYKPEEFGDTLVVEHRLEKSGGGSYKLKDGEHATGRSAKKKEIDEICAHLNIQANNPCALLTQEHAKKFLHEGNEQDRYRFFLQAANLETRKRDLNSAVEQVGVLKRRLESAKQGQSTKEEIARAAREEFEGATKLTELQVEMDSLEPLLGWALVNDRQDKITEAEEAIAKAEETEKATLDQMHTLTKEQGSVEAEVARLREKQKRALLTIERRFQEGQVKNAQGKELKKKQKKLLRDLESSRSDLEQNKAEIVEIVKDEKQAYDAMRDGMSAAEKKQADRLKTLREEQEAASEAHARLMVQVNSDGAENVKAIENWQEAKDRAKMAADEAQYAATQAKIAKDAKDAKLSALHPQLPELEQVLTKALKAKEFEGLVVGPLGKYLSVRPELGEFSLPAEAAVTAGLCDFVVTCSDDERRLRALLAKLPLPRQGPAAAPPLARALKVLIRPAGQKRFPVRRAARREADEPPSLLDVLSLTGLKTNSPEEDLVFNHLIDSHKADTLLLFTSEQGAREYVFGGLGGNCVAFICEGPKIAARKIFKRNATTGNEGVRPNPRGLLAADRKAQLAALEAAAKEAADLAKSNTARMKELDAERKATGKARIDRAKEAATAQLRSQKLEDEIDDLKLKSASSIAQQEYDRVNKLKSLTAGQGRELESNIAQMEVEARQVAEQMAPLHQLAAELKAEYDQLDAEKTQIDDELVEVEASSKKIDRTLRQSRKAVEEAQRVKAQETKECEKLQKTLKGMVPQVEAAFGPRVIDPKKRKTAQLQLDKNRLEVKMKRTTEAHGGKDLSELRLLAARAAAEFEEGKAGIANVDDQGNKQMAALKERTRFFRRECKQKGLQCTSDFNIRLSKRGHAGTLTFNHEDESLALEVTRNSQDARSASTTDARNLSGGERSYTTLSFELAMWEFCTTPFRVLDEFDVYMDENYRRKAVEILLEICTSQPQRQFIFLTPQDMHPFLSNLPSATVPYTPTITKMADPRPKEK